MYRYSYIIRPYLWIGLNVKNSDVRSKSYVHPKFKLLLVRMLALLICLGHLVCGINCRLGPDLRKTEASFPFSKIWSLYLTILGKAIPSAIGHFRLAQTHTTNSF